MSPSVHERLQELESDVRNLQVLPAAAVRARGRRRGRRQLTAVMAAGAVVVATAGVALAWPQERTVPAGDSPATSSGVTCVLTLPDSPADIHVRLLDGGAPAGSLDATVTQMRARKFTVLNGTTDPQPVRATTVVYGPEAIGAATVLRAAVYGDVTMQFDPDRRDQAMDLTLGPAFTRLSSTTELNQNLAAAGEPSAPPQCSTVATRAPGR